MMTFKNSVNNTKFKTFLEELRNKNPFDDVILMMDNLSIQSLSRYISRSIQNYYRDYADKEIEEMVERDMSSTDFDKFFKNMMEK